MPWDGVSGGLIKREKELKAVAQALGARLLLLEVRSANDLEKAFDTATKERADALAVPPAPFFVGERERRIVEFATKNRLPAIYPSIRYIEAGGLMFYGPDGPKMFRRAAYYVDKILKGAKPADLPVEQPTKFELVIYLKTAKQIGVTIPPNVLVRADRVIK